MVLLNFQLLPLPASFPFYKPVSSIKLSLSSNKGVGDLYVTYCSSRVQTITKNEAEVPDRRRLIAQNVPWNYTDKDIKRVFEQYGSVLNVELSMHDRTRNRGLAFVTMSSKEEATAALDKLNFYELDGRIIKLDYAKSVSKKKSSPEPQIPKLRYTVYVGNLTGRVRSQELRDHFKEFGNVLTAEVVFQSNPARPAGYGFVSFGIKEEAEAAISTLNGKAFMGRTMRLAFKKIEIEREAVTNQTGGI